MTDLPPDLQPGCYGAVEIPGNFFGKMISLLTYPRNYKGIRYNHAFIYLGEGLIAEAQPRGGKISHISKYNGMHMIFNTEDQMTQEQRDVVCITAKTLAAVKIPYGFLDIEWLALHLSGYDWNWLESKVDNEAREICSQWVAFCGQMAGLTDWLCGVKTSQRVIPAMLADRCNRSTHIGSPVSVHRM